MDSGSWFAIWAICLRTSFFVMMPRSLLEKKQNREKRSTLQYWLMPFPEHQCLYHLGTQRDNITQHPLRVGAASWVSPGQWSMGRHERCPSQVALTFLHTLSPTANQRQRSQWRTLRSQGIDKEPPDSKTCILEWLLQSPHRLQLTLDMTREEKKTWHIRPLRLQTCLLYQ